MQLFKLCKSKKIIPSIIKATAVAGTGMIIHNIIVTTCPKNASLINKVCIFVAEWFIVDIVAEAVYNNLTKQIQDLN